MHRGDQPALTDHETAELGIDRVGRAAADAQRAEVAFLDQLADLAEAEWFRREGASSLTGWLRRRFDLEPGEAGRLARRVQLLIQLPDLRSALVNHRTGLGHLKVLDRYATADRRRYCAEFTEQLVGFACSLSVDDYAVVCARWAELVDGELAPRELPEGSLTITPTLFGQARITGQLTADQADPVTRALRSMVAPQPADAVVKRPYRERLADALADLTQAHLDSLVGADTPSAPAGDPPASSARGNARARSTTTLIVDLDTLLERNTLLWEGTDREQPVLDQIRRSNAAGRPLPASVAGLLLCDTNIQRLVVDPHGRPVDVGRRHRIVTSAQRAALAIRDGGCVFPTCTRPAEYCDAHHFLPWEEGGPTDLHNLGLLCRHHHRLVHGDTWAIERDPVTGAVTVWCHEAGLSTGYRRGPDGGLLVGRTPNELARADP